MMVEQSLTFVVALVALFTRMLVRSEAEQRRRERLEEASAPAGAEELGTDGGFADQPLTGLPPSTTSS
jgi:hypothetical protein